MPAPRRPATELRLRSFRTLAPAATPPAELALRDGQVAAAAEGSGARVLDLGGRWLLPGLVNAHEHLDQSSFPPLGRPPYANAYEWAAGVDPTDAALRWALGLPLVERLWLGGLRNLLAGATAVLHHGPDHRALGRPDFPVRVQRRYDFALSPGQTPELRRSYRTTDRRIPWLVHAGEGTDARSAGELEALAAANVLRQNTVVARGIAFGPEHARRLAAASACLVWCPEADRWQYGATADVPALRAAGVRLGLGSESPAGGARDLLSTLAAARREGFLDQDQLLELAWRGSAEVARLPLGGLEPGAPADFVLVDDLERWLAGERSAIALVIVAGRPLLGSPELMEAAGARAVELRVDGAERCLAAGLAPPLRAHLGPGQDRGVRWLAGLALTPP